MVEESSPSLCEVMSTTTVILQTQMCAEADHTHFQCNYAVHTRLITIGCCYTKYTIRDSFKSVSTKKIHLVLPTQ